MSEFLFPKDAIASTSNWHDLWQGMPKFSQDDLMPDSNVIVNFACESDRQAFAKLLEQALTPKTKSVWYPKAEIGRMTDKRFVDAP